MLGQPESIGRYRILDCIGRGGMGVLYRGHDPMLERDVAIKLMLVDFTADQVARERFHREARAVARLQHRNVVTIHELGEADGTPYIVMEYLAGRDLDALIHGQTPLSLDQKFDITIQLCAGLAYAHEQGIVHRDIKPGNVRVLDDGTVKILDFGIAKFAMSAMTHSGSIMGTANYMAPEQIAGEPVDGRADLFSAGVLLYELISGRKPFAGDSPTAIVYQIMHQDPVPIRSLVADVPDGLIDIVARALKKKPEERYARASEMAADLQVLRALLSPSAAPGVMPAATAGTLAGTPASGPIAPPSGAMAGAPPALSPRSGGGSGPLAAAPTFQGATATPAAGLDVAIRDAAGEPGSDTAVRARRPRSTASSLVGPAAAILLIAVVVGILFVRGIGRDRGSEAPPAATGARPAAAASAGSTPAAPAATGFKIHSVPSGARIVVDGNDTGKVTPAALPLEGSFPKKLQLSLEGYQTVVVSLQAADVRAGSREFALEKEATSVRVTITGGYPFEVVQGTRVISAAAPRHELALPAGQSVKLRSREHFLDQSVAIEARRDGRRAIAAPGLGTVAVFSSVETCTIVLDGRDIGFPPIPRQQVAAGPHSVSIRCPEGQSETRRITVTAGERTAVAFDPSKS